MSSVALGGELSSTVRSASGSGSNIVSIVNARLSTESGVAVSISDRTAQSVIYCVPYRGNQIALYNGASWDLLTFAQTSLTLSGLTSGTNYDIFAFNSGGNIALELSAAWASDTVRTDLITTQDGVPVKSGAPSRRLLGTLRTTGTTTTEDSAGGSTTQVGGKRFLWNLYNQVERTLRVTDMMDSWSYQTATWRQANGATGNRVEYVSGDSATNLSVDVLHAVFLNTSTGTTDPTGDAASSVGIDSTTIPSGTRSGARFDAIAVANLSGRYPLAALFRGQPGLGYHALNWLEIGNGGSTQACFFIGDDGADQIQSGLRATVPG